MHRHLRRPDTLVVNMENTWPHESCHKEDVLVFSQKHFSDIIDVTFKSYHSVIRSWGMTSWFCPYAWIMTLNQLQKKNPFDQFLFV